MAYKSATQSRTCGTGYSIIISMKTITEQRTISHNSPLGDGGVVSIMTSLALSTTDIFNRHTVHFMIFEIIMKLFINAVKFISVSRWQLIHQPMLNSENCFTSSISVIGP